MRIASIVVNIIGVVLVLCTLSLNYGCKATVHYTIPSDTTTERPVAKEIHMPADSGSYVYARIKNFKTVSGFYSSREYRPAWIISDHTSALADSMISFIGDAFYYGLRPYQYHFDEIEILQKGLKGEENLQRMDALLTDAFLLLASDLKYGITGTTDKHNDSSAVLLLQEIMEKGGLIQALESREPQHAGYKLLKKGLRAVRDTTDIEVVGGPSTFNKIQLFEVNLERWRLESTPFKGRFIFINIPSFRFQLLEGDSVGLESKVIVGTPETPTPLVTSMIECFVIYPYWHVPRKIAVEEYLPLIQKDTSFITRNNFDILDRNGKVISHDTIDWTKFNKNYFPVVLRQREGPDNSLGVIKFVFDNPYAVFLHDTNTKRLFNNKYRAFSHGCIRMEKAIELAHYLMTGSLHITSDIVRDNLRQKKRFTVQLKHPIPIYLRYFTLEFKDNALFHYPDLYQKDPVLLKKMYP